MNELVQIVSNVGFPIVVALYMIITMQKEIKYLTEAINRLESTIKELTNARN